MKLYRGTDEADISAEKAKGKEEARLPEPEFESRWEEGAGTASGEGQEAPHNSIGVPLSREKLGRNRVIRDRAVLKQTLRTGRAIRTEYFTATPPASTTVVGQLVDPRMLIEVEAIAALYS